MANANSNLIVWTYGMEGYIFDLPVKGSTHIYEGTLIAQLTAGGFAVPYSTAGSEHAVGVATHEQDASLVVADGEKRIRVESYRMFGFANGTAGDAFADTDKIGAPVYASDDHTAAKTATGGRKPIGFFMGLDVDNRVRVFVDPMLALAHTTLA